jgi:hypothetical protein
MNPAREAMTADIKVAYYPAGHVDRTSYSGRTTDSMPKYSFDLKDAEILTEPGFYYITQATQEIYNQNNFNYTTTPVKDNGNQPIDGKNGKGKEWVMIEE